MADFIRLTGHDEYDNANIIAIGDNMVGVFDGLDFDETNALTAALNRLAEYEDIGLSPKEVKFMKEVQDKIATKVRNTVGVQPKTHYSQLFKGTVYYDGDIITPQLNIEIKENEDESF